MFHKFESFMKKNGIDDVKSAPFHPPSYGLAKRAVRTKPDCQDFCWVITPRHMPQQETLNVEFDFWPSDSWQIPECLWLSKYGYKGTHTFLSLTMHTHTHGHRFLWRLVKDLESRVCFIVARIEATQNKQYIARFQSVPQYYKRYQVFKAEHHHSICKVEYGREVFACIELLAIVGRVWQQKTPWACYWVKVGEQSEEDTAQPWQILCS